jgi:hypothetical protein
VWVHEVVELDKKEVDALQIPQSLLILSQSLIMLILCRNSIIQQRLKSSQTMDLILQQEELEEVEEM